LFFTKANLQVVQTASRDKDHRAFNIVRIEEDGSTVASNGRLVMVVSPSPNVTYWPERACEPCNPPQQGLAFAPEVIDVLLKQIGRATKAPFVCLSKHIDPNRVGFTTVNDRADPTTHAATPRRGKWPNWREFFQGFRKRKRVRICINRKDLIHLLKAMEAACPDKGGINPIYIEVDEDGKHLFGRCENFETDQRAIGAINAYDTSGIGWLKQTKWERSIYYESRVQQKEE